MTWFIRLTAKSDISGRVDTHDIRIPGDTSHELLYNGDFKWKHLDAMMARGSLLRVDIDYRPTMGAGGIPE